MNWERQSCFRTACLLAIIAAASLLPAASSLAKTNTAPSNRWLIIVQTSRSMQPRAEAAHRLAADLVASGMNGQMRNGDTLGLWTFNDELHTGNIPLQDWFSSGANQIARRTYNFLSEQKNEKEPRLEKVSPEMLEVVKSSDFITVILISDGSSARLGTPFDERIQASYREWASQQQQKQMPFITVLRAEAGVFKHFIVNTPPFPLEFPPLPEELLKPRVVESRTAAPEPPKPPPVTLPPLIISGRKPEPVVTSSQPTNTPVAASQSEISPAMSQPATTNTAPSVAQPAPPAPASNATTAVPPGETRLRPQATSNTTAGSTAKQSKALVWMASGTAAGVALLLVFVLARRRNPSRVSLITRSLDREGR